MTLRPILDPKIGTIRRLKSERLIGIAEYPSLSRRAGWGGAIARLAMPRIPSHKAKITQNLFENITNTFQTHHLAQIFVPDLIKSKKILKWGQQTIRITTFIQGM